VPWWPPAPPHRSPWPLRWLLLCPRPVAGRFSLGGVPCLRSLPLFPPVSRRSRPLLFPLSALAGALRLSCGGVASPSPRRRAGGGVFWRSPAGAGVPPAGVGGRFLCSGRWPFGRCWVRGWRRCVRSFHRPRRRGVFCSRRSPPQSHRVCCSFGLSGSGGCRWWPWFGFRGVPLRALPRWPLPFAPPFGLLLRFGFGVLGVRRSGRWSRSAPGGFPLRVFGLAALGRLGSRWRWGVGARFLIRLVAIFFLPPVWVVFLRARFR
jgi:hypothetical protein